MPYLVVIALVGFGAQLINGSLGMGFGVISTTFILASGTAPALASATVQLAGVGASAAAGIAHWRFGNVDWLVVSGIAIPGGIGAFAGATFLSSLDTATAAPIMSGILLLLGLYILIRFTAWGTPRGQLGKPLRRRFLAPLGIVGGFLNSTGGGGWGPVATPALLSSGRLEPRTVVGTVDAAEFLVVLAGSLGFLAGLGFGTINFGWVAMLLAGGVLAAPVAAWLTKLLPGRILGSLVGGLIVLTNISLILGSDWVAISASTQAGAQFAVVVVWAAAIAWSWRAHRLEQASNRAAEAAGVTEESSPELATTR